MTHSEKVDFPAPIGAKIVNWLLRDRYPSIDRIADVTSPVLIIVGDTEICCKTD